MKIDNAETSAELFEGEMMWRACPDGKFVKQFKMIFDLEGETGAYCGCLAGNLANWCVFNRYLVMDINKDLGDHKFEFTFERL